MSGRVPRQIAASALEELLLRVASQAEPYARSVRRVSVFGSFARGAVEVGDIDLLVDAELTGELRPLAEQWREEALAYIVRGQAAPKRLRWEWHLKRQLSTRRVLQIHVSVAGA